MFTPLLLTAALLSAPPPVDDAVTSARLEPMLEAGDTEMVVATFHRHPSRVLPFFDGYLEGGLRLIEEGGTEAEGLASFRTGVAFARLASEALGDDIFVRYAASFASWSPSERSLFREGQNRYRDGRRLEADEPARALEAYLESHFRAVPLGDAWGRAMAAAGAARVEVRLDRRDAALRHAREAADLYDRLRLSAAELGPRLELARLEPDPVTALASARRAWHLSREAGTTITEERRRDVLEVYLQRLEEAGQLEAANTLRSADEALRP